MVEQSYPYTHFTPNYKNDSIYFHENQTYDVTHFVKGLYIDLIVDIINQLNSTISFYKREDGNWGTLINNGTKWTGMFDNIVNGNADLISASLLHSIDRAKVADFLPPIQGV